MDAQARSTAWRLRVAIFILAGISAVLALRTYAQTDTGFAQIVRLGGYAGCLCPDCQQAYLGAVWHEPGSGPMPPAWRMSPDALWLLIIGPTAALALLGIVSWPLHTLMIKREARRQLLQRADPCSHCGYSLKGLSRDTKCPECGWQSTS